MTGDKEIKRFDREEWIKRFEDNFREKLKNKYGDLPRKLERDVWREFEDYYLEMEDYFYYDKIILLDVDKRDKTMRAIFLKKKLIGIEIIPIEANISVPEHPKLNMTERKLVTAKVAKELKTNTNTFINMIINSLSDVAKEMTYEMIGKFIQPCKLTPKDFFRRFITYRKDFNSFMDMIVAEGDAKEARRQKIASKQPKQYLSCSELDSLMFKPSVNSIYRETGNNSQGTFDFVEVSIPILSNADVHKVKELAMKNKESLFKDCLKYIGEDKNYSKYGVPTSYLRMTKWAMTRDRQLIITFELKNIGDFSKSNLFS